MIKLKPQQDAEAKVIGFEELMHNANEAETSNLGLTKRSSAKAGQVPMNTLGAIVVDWEGKPLRIGIFKGFTKAQLHQIWLKREDYMGQRAKFKYWEIGSQGLPLHARLIQPGFRASFD